MPPQTLNNNLNFTGIENFDFPAQENNNISNFLRILEDQKNSFNPVERNSLNSTGDLISNSDRYKNIFSSPAPDFGSYVDQLTKSHPQQSYIADTEYFDSIQRNWDPKYPKYFQGVDNNELYSQMQPWYKSVGKGLVQFVGKTAINLGQGVSLLGSLAYGIFSDTEEEKKYKDAEVGVLASWIGGAMDNKVTQFLEAQKDNLTNEWLPIYNSAKDQQQGFFKRAFTDLEFWTSDFTDGAAFMASALLGAYGLGRLSPGTSVVKGLSNISKGVRAGVLESDALTEAMSGASRMVGKYQNLNNLGQIKSWITNAELARKVDVGVAAIYNTGMEALVEGMNTKKDVYNKLSEQFPNMSEEEKLKRSAIAGMSDALLNIPILAASSLFEANLIMKKLPSTSNKFSSMFTNSSAFLGEEALNKTSKLNAVFQGGKKVVEGVWWEGFWEENLQLAAQRLSEQYATTRKGEEFKDTGILRSIQNVLNIGEGVLPQGIKQASDAVAGKDQEAALSIGLGGLMGSMISAPSAVREALKSNMQTEKIKSGVLNTPINAFKSANFFQYEEVDTREVDSAGNSIKRKVYKLNEKGHPIYDKDKLEAYIVDKAKIYEYTELMHAAQNNEHLEDLATIIKNDLFAKAAEAYFSQGLGQLFYDKFDIDPSAIKDEDMAIMGLTPASSSREDVIKKLNEFKTKTKELEAAYNSIQLNMIASSKDYEDNEARKSEVFRLVGKQIAYKELLKKYPVSNNIYEQYQNKLSDIDRAKNYLDHLTALHEVSPKPYDSYYIAQATENLEKVTTELENFKKVNDDTALKNAKIAYDAVQDLLSPLTKASQQKEQIKKSEIQLSLNSITERLNQLVNPKTGLDYYKKYVNSILTTQNNKVIFPKPTLTDKTTIKEYEDFEKSQLRLKRIVDNYQDIDSKAISEELFKTQIRKKGKIVKEDLEKYINELKNLNGKISKEDLQKHIDKINEELKEYTKEVSGLTQKEYEELDSVPNEYRSEEEEESLSKYLQAVKEKDNFINSINAIQTKQKIEYTDNNIKRLLANDFIEGAKKIITDFEQSQGGFDSAADLNLLTAQLQNLSVLKRLFEERQDILETKEFLDFIPEIQNLFDKLSEIIAEVKKRISDRTAEDYNSQKNTLSILSSFLIKDKSSELYKYLKSTIGLKYKEEFEKIEDFLSDGEVKDETSEKNTIAEQISVANLINKLTALYKYNLSESELSLFEDKINSFLENAKNKVYTDTAITDLVPSLSVSVTYKSFEQALKFSPEKTITNLANLLLIPYTNLLSSNEITQDQYNSLPEHQLLKDLNLVKYLNALNTSRASLLPSINTNNIHDNKELIRYVKESLIPFLSLFKYSKYSSSLDQIKQIENELELIKTAPFAPSNQQTQAIREFLEHVHSNRGDKLFSDFAYLKAPPGAGKTSIVNWITNILGYNSDEIVAGAPTQASSEELNKSIGGKDREYLLFDGIIDKLKTPENIKLIIIDEVGRINNQQLEVLGDRILEINQERESDDKISVLLLGDPNQINVVGDIFWERPFIEHPTIGLSTENSIKHSNYAHYNIRILTPLSIRYRSNVQEINLLANKFVNNNKDLIVEPITVQSSISLSSSTNTEEPLGVYSSNNFDEDLIKYLSSQDLSDGKTRVLAVTEDKVEDYKKLILSHKMDNVEVAKYLDLQGRTVNEIYINVPKLSIYRKNLLYNNVINTLITRATNFVFITGFNMTNEYNEKLDSSVREVTIDPVVAKEKFVKTKEEELATIKKIFSEEMRDKIEEISIKTTATKTKSITTEDEEDTEDSEEEGIEKKDEKDTEEGDEEGIGEEDDIEYTSEDTFSEEETETTEENLNNEDSQQSSEKGTIKIKGTSKKDEVSYSFNYPSNTSVKQLIFDETKKIYRFLSPNIKTSHEVIDTGLTVGDKIEFFITPSTTSTKKEYAVIAVKKNSSGEGYRLVSVLSDKEVAELQDINLKNKIEEFEKAVKKDPNILKNLMPIALLNSSTKDLIIEKDLENKIFDVQNLNSSRVITNANNLQFVYQTNEDGVVTDEEYTPLRWNTTIKNSIFRNILHDIYGEIDLKKEIPINWPTFLERGVEKPYTMAQVLEEIERRSKIVLVTDSMLNKKVGKESYLQKYPEFSYLQQGVPYIMIEGGFPQHKLINKGKDMWVRLDRVPLNDKDPFHKKYLEPLTDFFNLKRKINTYLKDLLVLPNGSPYPPSLKKVGLSYSNWVIYQIAEEHKKNPTKLNDKFFYHNPKFNAGIQDLGIDLSSFTKSKAKEILDDFSAMIELVHSELEPSQAMLYNSVEGDYIINAGDNQTTTLIYPRDLFFKTGDKEIEELEKKLIASDYIKDKDGGYFKKVKVDQLEKEDLSDFRNIVVSKGKDEFDNPIFKSLFVHYSRMKNASVVDEAYVDTLINISDPVSIRVTKVHGKLKSGPAQIIANEIYRSHYRTFEKAGIKAKLVKLSSFGKNVVLAPNLLPKTQDSFYNSSTTEEDWDLEKFEELFSYESGGNSKRIERNDTFVRLYLPLISNRKITPKTINGKTYTFYNLNFTNVPRGVDSRNNNIIENNPGTKLNSLVRTNFKQVLPTVISYAEVEDDSKKTTATKATTTKTTKNEDVEPIQDTNNEPALESLINKIVEENSNFKQTPRNTKFLITLVNKIEEGEETLDTVIKHLKFSNWDFKQAIENLNFSKENSPFFSLSEDEETKKFYESENINLSQMRSLLKKAIPSLSNSEVKSKIKFIQESEWFQANLSENQWGYFKNGVIYLRDTKNNNTAKKIVVLHEIAHLIHDNYLTQMERDALYREYEKTFPNEIYPNQAYKQRLVEEWLADKLMEIEPIGVSWLQRLIQRIKNLFTFVSSEIQDIDSYISAFKTSKIGLRNPNNINNMEEFIKTSLKNETIKKKC